MDPDDVASSLHDLERKLRELERDLKHEGQRGSQAEGPGLEQQPLPPAFAPSEPIEARPAADFHPGADPQELVREARSRIQDLRDELDDLTRTREQIGETASELTGPPPPPPTAPSPHAGQWGASWNYAATGGGGWTSYAPISVPRQGTVVVDVGYFRDVASLAEFEQALTRIPGVAGAVVRTYSHGRGVIDVQLAHPVALEVEIGRFAGAGYVVTSSGPQHLVLALTA